MNFSSNSGTKDLRPISQGGEGSRALLCQNPVPPVPGGFRPGANTMNNPPSTIGSANILAVDNDVDFLEVCRWTMEDMRCPIFFATSGQEALQRLEEREYAVILLDIAMDDMDGFEIATHIRNNPNTRHVPILFISGMVKTEKAVIHGYEIGAVDYLFKPFQTEALRAKVLFFLDLYRKNKAIEVQNAQLLQTKQNLEQEITQRKRAESALQEAHDLLEKRVEQRTQQLIEANQLLAASEQKYRVLFESTPAGIAICDTQGWVLTCNPAWRQMLQCQSTPGESATLEPDRKILHQLLATATEFGVVRDREIVLNSPDTQEIKFALINVNPVQVGDLSLFMVTARDITQRKQTLAERDRLIQELQDALAKVKTLSGLLPICACCKKIRDDSGYWTQIELFIQKHSDALFTHGLCPECTHSLYPGLCPRPEPQ